MNRTRDIIDQNTFIVRGIGRQIEHLADAFYRTGNDTLGEELSKCADALQTAANTISEEYNREKMVQVDQSLANGERFTATLLKSLINDPQKDPKDALLSAVKHHLDTDIIEAHEAQK